MVTTLDQITFRAVAVAITQLSAIAALLWTVHWRQWPRVARVPSHAAHLLIDRTAPDLVAPLALVLVIWGVICQYSLSPLLSEYYSLLTAANVLAFGLALIVWRRSGSESFRDCWRGTESDPDAFGIPLKMWVRHLSLLGQLVLSCGFGWLQFDRYGRLSTPMALWIGF